MMQPIVSAVLHDTGSVDVQIYPSPLTLEEHGQLIGTMVRLVAQYDRETIGALLKEINRAAYGHQPLNVQPVH